MKKLLSLMLSALCLMTAASAFAQESVPETVVIQALNGNRESIELTVPFGEQPFSCIGIRSLRHSHNDLGMPSGRSELLSCTWLGYTGSRTVLPCLRF